MYKELDFLGYPGYRIWDDGRIESCRKNNPSNKWKEMKCYKDKKSYVLVRLFKSNNKSKLYYLHRLLALAFIPNPNNYPYVLHNNGITDDNRIENLRWGTAKHNAEDSIKHGTFHYTNTIGIKNGRSKLTENDVKEIKLLIKNKVSGVKIAKQFNIHVSVISDIKNNKLWTHINE